MTTYAALLRAVNVGGTSLLRMSDLVRIAEECGLEQPRTVLASGNLVFTSRKSERTVKAALEQALGEHMGRPVDVFVRTAEELAAVEAANPFPETAAKGTSVIFLDARPPAKTLEGVVAPGGEEVRLGTRELYVHYPNGMGRSKLRIPGADRGTARGIATVARLVQLTAKEE